MRRRLAYFLSPNRLGDNARKGFADLAKEISKPPPRILTDYEKMGGRNPQALETTGFARRRTRQTRGRGGHSRPPQITFPRLTKTFTGISGDLWFAQNNTKGAIREYGAVVALHPSTRLPRNHLARAYLAAGQKDMAEEHLLASSKPHPAFGPLRNCCCN